MFSWKIKGFIFLLLNLFLGLFFQVQKLIVPNYPQRYLHKASIRILEFKVWKEKNFQFKTNKPLYLFSDSRIFELSSNENKIILDQNSSLSSLLFAQINFKKEGPFKNSVRIRKGPLCSFFLSSISCFDSNLFQKNQFRNYQITFMKSNFVRKLDWFTSIHPSASPPDIS